MEKELHDIPQKSCQGRPVVRRRRVQCMAGVQTRMVGLWVECTVLPDRENTSRGIIVADIIQMGAWLEAFTVHRVVSVTAGECMRTPDCARGQAVHPVHFLRNRLSTLEAYLTHKQRFLVQV